MIRSSQQLLLDIQQSPAISMISERYAFPPPPKKNPKNNPLKEGKRNHKVNGNEQTGVER